jgi:hypothetical protein
MEAYAKTTPAMVSSEIQTQCRNLFMDPSPEFIRVTPLLDASPWSDIPLFRGTKTNSGVLFTMVGKFGMVLSRKREERSPWIKGQALGVMERLRYNVKVLTT